MITRLEDEGFPVTAVCQALGVSRAGYYAHTRGEAGPRDQEDARPDEEELAEGLTSPPVSPGFPQQRLERWLDEQVHPEWRVARWHEKEDGVPESYPGYFGLHYGVPDGYDEKEYERYWSEVSQQTKLGSVPFWIQFPQVPPGGRFLGQIDSNCCQAFGDNGIGYVFLSVPTSAPRGWFLWQCT